MKRVSHKTCRKVFVSLVVGASVAAGAALAQSSGLPTSPPLPATEVAPPPRPETTVTPNGTALTVPLGGSRQFQMPGNKSIRSVYNQQDDVASVDPTSDRSKLLISGKKAGTSRLTLIAEDNTKEVVDLVVQPDVKYLRSLLMQAVPTSNLTIIPAASGTLIIGGTVTQAEDIEIVLNTAKAVMGAPANVINAMRVGGVQQVQLDVVIATVDRTKARQFGLDFLAEGRHYSVVSTFSGSSGSSLSSASSGLGAGASSFTPPAIGETANVVSGLFNLGDGNNILTFLTALTTDSVTKLLAEPRVVALSGHPANFYSGGEQAVPTISGGSGSATAGIDFKPFGTTIQVLPIVLGDGKIYLEVDPKVDIPVKDPLFAAPIPGTPAGLVFGRTGQEVHTSVVMEDGQTFVIGGLIQHTVDASIQKIPCLGDCPFIGTFFSTKQYTEGEQELVILVTPHLVDAASCCQLPKLLPGQETRTPDDFELFFEGLLEAPRGRREVFCNGRYVPAYEHQAGAPVGDPVGVPVSANVSAGANSVSTDAAARPMPDSAVGQNTAGPVPTPVTAPVPVPVGGGS